MANNTQEMRIDIAEGKSSTAMIEFVENGKKGLAVVYATEAGNFLSPQAVKNLIELEMRKLTKKLIEKIDDEPIILMSINQEKTEKVVRANSIKASIQQLFNVF